MQLLRNDRMTYASKHVGIDISEICYGILDTEWNLSNLRASFTRVYFPLSGEAFLTVGGKRIALRPGTVYVVPSGLNFSGYCPEAMEKIYVHLVVTRPDGADVFGGIDRCLLLPDRQKDIQEAERLYRATDLGAILQFKLLLHRIVNDALALCPSGQSELKNYSELTQAALDYIHSHLRADLSIDEVASSLFVSKLVLQKKFRLDLGQPIGRYIDDCVLSHAERDLLDADLTIQQISERWGYCDQFYFSRKFSKARGLSPKQFRQWH